MGSDFASAALVPIPASRAARRRRGEDVWGRVVAAAAALLVIEGRCARVEPVIRLTRQPRDQSTLSSTERLDNMRDAFMCTRVPEGLIVIVDDIITTGATVAAAARALDTAGAEGVSVAAIAATYRGGA